MLLYQTFVFLFIKKYPEQKKTIFSDFSSVQEWMKLNTSRDLQSEQKDQEIDDSESSEMVEVLSTTLCVSFLCTV